ncbi:Anthocyanidin 3-O-glucoside 5-O-glucosyltransferase [Labeo rohita]|uniref:Anthocyanidin 3-O-glucoside 5-O-glucosyltransferase n=1 Tax=Labeo rohita TaxID=84645 RepID=A0ABQ8N1D7_LABRO|nr:Anthocyanidin 3-O-glucoside 5-O-glucosyltransferase [Labeo rohita]
MDEIGGLEENLTDGSEAMSQMTDDGEQWSDIQRDDAQDLYTVDEINAFLDETKGKFGVEIKDYFPDVEKFILSVTHIRKKSNEELTQQKRFRLKKHLTNIRKKRYQLRKTTEGKN